MRLAELVKQLGGSLSPLAGEGPKITGVHLDSRQVGVGDLFAALSGTREDGARFVEQALGRNAAAVLTARPLPIDALAMLDARELAARSTSVGRELRLAARSTASASELSLAARLKPVQQWIHPDARRIAGEAAALVYGEPARDMFLVGITGTNGKTTTAHLIGHLLTAAGRRPAVLGTAGHRLANGVLVAASHTTPDAPTLQRLLRDHRAMGGDSAVLEASSHALDQERTAGLDFDVAVFTNLTRDHLDYHVDLERYAEAKEKLFSSLGSESAAVVNADDRASERMARAARASGARVVTYSAGLGGDLCASALKTDLWGTELFLNGMGISRQRLRLPLAGRYNVENALAAAAVGLLSGASPSNVLDGLATARGAPGRLEPVPNERGFALLVDYAHSEDALENVCRVVRDALCRAGAAVAPVRSVATPPVPRSRVRCSARVADTLRDSTSTVHARTRDPRLIVVFGCGGDRDRGKRAPMGRVVNELADVAIVTSDNPRSEDPDAIIAEIVRGMEPARAERIVEPDRRHAIRRAVESARAGDVVLIAGKGHETTQTVGGQVFEFDDRKVALEAVQ
jgi:UDP-N-acetylmuramoyl-L-alanyl-D-glutamate--2,6-diaminopimelate ligase